MCVFVCLGCDCVGGDLCLGCVGGFDGGEKYGDKNTTPAVGGVFLLPLPRQWLVVVAPSNMAPFQRPLDLCVKTNCLDKSKC